MPLHVQVLAINPHGNTRVAVHLMLNIHHPHLLMSSHDELRLVLIIIACYILLHRAAVTILELC